MTSLTRVPSQRNPDLNVVIGRTSIQETPWTTAPTQPTSKPSSGHAPTACIQNENAEMINNLDFDVVVIGAGIYGIQAARTYLELHPKARVVILEASGSVGGVWSRPRVYEDFWTQTPLGILEFSDQPMHAVPPEDCYDGFFKAKHVSEYLESYCGSHIYNEDSLGSRVRFNSPVNSVTKPDQLWRVICNKAVYSAPQLIDASGLTSTPNWPELTNVEVYKGQVLHHKDFATFERQLNRSTGEKPNSIAVIGGAKSAADIVYSCAKAGFDVSWIIRHSGAGPAALVSTKGQLGYANSNESFYTRVTSLFLASIFSISTGYTWIQNLIHKTPVGRYLLRRVWRRIHEKACREANYDREDGRANGFFNLKPDTEIFWQNDSTGVNQRADFFDVVATRVKVVREDVSHFYEQGVVIGDTRIKADAVFCATGWKSKCLYLDDNIAARLGLPATHSAEDTDSRPYWESLERDAERDVLQRFPILDSAWAHQQSAFVSHKSNAQTPFRLWKSMVPPCDPSIIFLGRVMLGNHFRNAEVQALFACAVLDAQDQPSRARQVLPDRAEMERDIAKVVAWCRRRYLRKGFSGNWFYWDLIPYTDMLLAQLGLSSHRGCSLSKDLLRPGFAKDLAGLIDEYKSEIGGHTL